MRQRLGLAAALLRVPRLLLLDEPTSGLDPAGARDVAALVRELAADGVAVLLSSHHIGELERVCDAYTFMRDGGVVWHGSAAELTAQAPASAYALVTSDDERALSLAAVRPGVRAARATGGTLTVAIAEPDLDGFILALAAAEVAVRRLELLASPLESMFFALSEDRAVAELAPDEVAGHVLAEAGR
jgi:ABC-2 type transport system ATP-binding protein